jgi:hypothetical protein
VAPNGADRRSRKDPTNAKIFSFMDAHREDAQELAAQVNVPWEFVLGASAAETGYGTMGIVAAGTPPTSNYFGLQVNNGDDIYHYIYQISTYMTARDGWVATFSTATGFLDSGLNFVMLEKPYILGQTNVNAFANAIHAHGYGVGSPGYVSDLTHVIGLITARENCPR